MEKGNFLLIFLLIIFSTSAFAASTVYWLRGQDISAEVEGGNFSFMSSTPSGSTSSETINEFNLEKGTGELTRWYSSKFPSDFLLSGEIYFFASEFELLSGDAEYRLVFYEFDSQTDQSNLIVSSDWLKFNGKTQDATVLLQTPFTINSQNSLKLVLEYNSISSASTIKLILDQPEPFQELVWNTPSNQSFSAYGVKNTAAVLFELCGTNSITCFKDLDCDDFQALTQNSCTDPGTCSASCDFTVCTTDCITSAECKDNNILTIDTCSEFGTCNAICKNEVCSIMCSTNSDCNDNIPSTIDSCTFPNTCLAFCQNTPCTGDDCIAEEINVCGNGICEFEEECPLDCNENKKIELLEINKGEYFLYGEEVEVKALVTGYSLSVKVSMNGFFGEIELVDDSSGVDDMANDRIFSSSFIVRKPAYGNEPITITAADRITSIHLVKYYVIAPQLELELRTDKENYYLTDKIFVSAFANKKGVTITKNLFLTLENSSGEKIAEEELSLNQYNLYSFNYQLSSLGEQGEIKVIGKISDEFGNTATKTQTVVFLKVGSIQRGFRIEILNLNKEISKGEIQQIEVIVKNDKGLAVKNVLVSVQLFNDSIIELTETALGVYSGTFKISETDFSGEHSITILAKKTIGENVLEAKLVEKVEVLELPIELEITGLEKNNFSIGTPVELRIVGKINGNPVLLKNVEIVLGDKKIFAKKDGGMFVATLVFNETHFPTTQITIKATDVYQNSGVAVIPLSVSGFYLPYYIEKDPPIFFILVMLVLAEVIGISYVVGRKNEQKRLKKRKTEVIKELKNVQKKYFQEGFMSRNDYDTELLKLENELKFISKKIKE